MGADADLWRGDTLPVRSRHLRLEGQVLTHDELPVPHACIELWHADPAGRYRHASAPGHTQVAAGFAGYGVTHGDAQGRFVFRSLVPGPTLTAWWCGPRICTRRSPAASTGW